MNNYAELNAKPNYGISNDFSPFDTNNKSFEELPAFALFQNNNGNLRNNKFGDYYCGGASELAMKDIGYETAVSKIFFSKENIKRIQKKIKSEVLRRSNGKFRLDVDQDENDLFIAMRAIFLDNAKNLPKYVVRQVKQLNKFVIEFIIPDIMTNIKQQYDYIKEISNPIRPPPLPLNVSRAGRKALPSTTTIWL
jgi:hypothetical protein